MDPQREGEAITPGEPTSTREPSPSPGGREDLRTYREGRNRLGDPDGSSNADTETWQDFLRAGQNREALRNSRSTEGGASRSTGTEDEAVLSQSHLRRATQPDGTTPESPRYRRLPRPASLAGTGQRRSSDIILPQWQPDSDVSQCPICKTPFSFWYRKHHCRKCGRVVCANCSPHRITIPRQFVVQPPELVVSTANLRLSDHEVPDMTGEEDGSIATRTARRNSRRGSAALVDASLGGGEEVRICNPCVPDPNITPPPQIAARARQEALAQSQPGQRPSPNSRRVAMRPRPAGGVFAEAVMGDSIRAMSDQERYFRVGQPVREGDIETAPTGARRRGVTFAHLPTAVSPYAPPAIRFPASSSASASSSSTQQPTPYTRPSHHRQTASLSTYPSAARAYHSPLQPAPATLLPDEAYCPVCSLPFPTIFRSPLTPDTTLQREAHVTSCIERATSSSPRRTAPNPSSDPNNPHPTSPHQTATQSSPSDPRIPYPGAPTNFSTRMLRFAATEKDCVGSDGEPVECVICLEEVEPGVMMGRLECLCRFHEECIRAWWGRKGGGCPVHIDGLGLR